jgi:hypothetical protein
VWLGLSCFILRAQASGAEIETSGATVNLNGNRVNIRQPFALGMPFGMADVLSELRSFTAQITLQF